MFNRKYGFNSRATSCKRHVMYSALVKLTVVRVPFGLRPFLQFDRRSLFILEPSSRYPNFFSGRTFSLCSGAPSIDVF